MSDSGLGALASVKALNDHQLRRQIDRARLDAAPAQARVYNNADISITNNTTTAVTFNSERWDTGNFHSTGANTSRLTAPTAGLYMVGGGVRFDANATGRRRAAIRLNGTTEIAAFEPAVDGDATATWVAVLSTTYQLAATDYVELTVFQNSGGALNLLSTANFSPEFWIVRLGSQA